MTGYSKIKRNKLPSYAGGGNFFQKNEQGLLAGASLIGSAGSALGIDDTSTGGTILSTLGSAGQGAALGTKILPGVGTAIGAGIGLVSGIIGGANKRRQALELKNRRIVQDRQNAIGRSNQILAEYDSEGVPTTLYAAGGPIDTAIVNRPLDKRFVPINKNLSIISSQRPNGYLVGSGMQGLLPMSDKSQGVASNYYPAFQQNRGKSIPTIKRLNPYAKGGMLNPEYEVEKGEIVQGNPLLEESSEIASDLHLAGGERHEDGGTLGIGGERVFSDRLKLDKDTIEMFKGSGINFKAKSTYADASKKLGQLKSKYEEKTDEAGRNTAKLMLPKVDSYLDNLFEIQENSKVVNSNKKFAIGGIISKIGTGALDFLNNNTGQVINAANYLANNSTINQLDTDVPTQYINNPQYNYVDRSAVPMNRNNSLLRTGIKALRNTGQSTNASNIAALYGQTLDSNSAIANQEANRRDAYNQSYGQRVDRTNAYNTQIYNQSQAEARDLRNQKVGLKLGARQALLEGIQGNIAAKQAQELEDKKLLTTLAANDNNGVMTRFMQNYPSYRNLLRNYKSVSK